MKYVFVAGVLQREIFFYFTVEGRATIDITITIDNIDISIIIFRLLSLSLVNMSVF